MYKLLYIGKSNKKFTNNNVYVIYGMSAQNKNFSTIIIKSNKGLVTLRQQHEAYFYENFKGINKEEETKIIRKNKLNKLKKNEL